MWQNDIFNFFINRPLMTGDLKYFSESSNIWHFGTQSLFTHIWEIPILIEEEMSHSRVLKLEDRENVQENAVKVPNQKTHLGKRTCLCSLRVSWLYNIWVTVKKAHSRKRIQLYGLWVQVLNWENGGFCFSRHDLPHKPLTYVFSDECSRVFFREIAS